MPAEADVDSIVLNTFFANKTGVLVEIGAARPDYLSIGASFRSSGWQVIAVEPNPDFCKAHRAAGHEILQYACSDEESDDASFFVVDSLGADYMGGEVSFESFSSLGIKGQFADLLDTVKAQTNVTTIPVKVRKLDTILQNHHPELVRFDVLAVDVEGWELNVLRGTSLGQYRPSIVILENVFKDPAYSTHMKKFGYSLWKTLEPNEIYVRQSLMKRLAMRIFA